MGLEHTHTHIYIYTHNHTHTITNIFTEQDPLKMTDIQLCENTCLARYTSNRRSWCVYLSVVFNKLLIWCIYQMTGEYCSREHLSWVCLVCVCVCVLPYLYNHNVQTYNCTYLHRTKVLPILLSRINKITSSSL